MGCRSLVWLVWMWCGGKYLLGVVDGDDRGDACAGDDQDGDDRDHDRSDCSAYSDRDRDCSENLGTLSSADY